MKEEDWYFYEGKPESNNPHYFRATEHKNVNTMDALCGRFVDGPWGYNLNPRTYGIRKCSDCRKRLATE